MRFFKFGDNGQVLAIALPSSAKKSANISEDQEYEFIDLGEGALLLVSRKKLDELAKSSLLGKLGEKFFPSSSTPINSNSTNESSLTSKTSNYYQTANLVENKPPIRQPIASNSLVSPTVITSALNIVQFNTKEIEQTLTKDGFVVLEENAAKSASSALESQIKAGNIVGVRGFDKKYYIVSKWFFEQTSAKMREVATDAELAISDIAKLSNISESAATAVLQVMKENGDILERKKGFFKILKS